MAGREGPKVPVPPMARLPTREATEEYFEGAGVRQLLRQYSIQLAVHQPADPELFIYEQLRAKFSKTSAPQTNQQGCIERREPPLTALEKEESWGEAAGVFGSSREIRETRNDIDEMLRKISNVGLNGRTLRELVLATDVNCDHKISLAEMKRALEDNLDIELEDRRLEGAWGFLLQQYGSTGSSELALEDLENAIEQAVDRKNLGDWLLEQKIHEIFVERLLPSSHHAGKSAVDLLVDYEPTQLRHRLAGVENEVHSSICSALAHHAAEMRAVAARSSSGGEENKFTWGLQKEGFCALFGDVALFRKGLNDIIGLPDTDIFDAMQAEHKDGEKSREFFETANYRTKTCPADEWDFVVKPDEKKEYAGEGKGHGQRVREDLSELMAKRPPSAHADKKCEGCSACLSREEVIALRLYSGPMYMFYNSVLRALLAWEVSKGEGKGDKSEAPAVEYRTTIHMISSGIVKLSEIMRRPDSRKVYRGLSGIKLPDKFWREDKLGWKGGVEMAFMSTTTDRHVALDYIGEGPMPIMFEIETSQIDRGASLRWCSQYPREEEVLLPPMSNLEVVGEPKMILHAGKSVMVFKLQLNINLGIMKREEHVGRRKALHLSSVNNAAMEITRDLFSECKKIKQTKEVVQSKDHWKAVEIVKKIVTEVKVLVESQDTEKRGPEWYNNDRNYKMALEEVALMKDMAFAKFKWWKESTEVGMSNLNQFSMLQALKFKMSKDYHTYCDLRECYSAKKFQTKLSETGQPVLSETGQRQVTRAEFIRVLKDNTPKQHEWTDELIETAWNAVKGAEGGEDDVLSLMQLALLPRIVCTTRHGRDRGLYVLPDVAATPPDGAVTICHEIKEAALQMIAIWVDESNLNIQYGVDEDTALITAASEGVDAELELYLDAGCDMEMVNNKGYSAIASAACQGMDDCLQILINTAHARELDMQRVLEQKTKRGETALLLACMHGWEDCTNVLIQHKADITTTDERGFSPFLAAAEWGHLSVLEMLYVASPDVIFSQSKKGKKDTALLLAARNGHLKVVARLLEWAHKREPENGMRRLVEMVRTDGTTALDAAAAKGGTTEAVSRRIARKLLQACPDMLVKLDKNGQSCLHAAAKGGKRDMFEWLLTQLGKHFGDSDEGQEQLCKFVLLKDKYEENCLHCSCVLKDWDTIKFVTNADNLVKLPNFHQDLHRSELLSKERAARLSCDLLKSTTQNGRNCLHIAAGLGSAKLVGFLLNEGWNREDTDGSGSMLRLVTQPSRLGRTAAHVAANFGHLSVLQKLAEHEPAFLLAADDEGWTALHFVADSDDVASTLITSLTSKRYKKVVLQKEAKGQVPGDIVDFLCELDTEHKVYANTEFRHLMFTAEHVLGRTPLNIAGGLGSDSTVKALLKQAARIEGGVQQVLTQADKLGRLPIHSAAGMRRHGIVDLMCNESTAPMDLALAADADGWNALFWALAGSKQMCLGGLQEAEMRKTVDTLLDRQRGCMEALDKSGISALHLACTTNNTELVRSFIDGDPKPQQRHCGTAGLSWETTEQPARIPWVSKGMSALLFAACSGAVSVVKLLCEDYALDPDEICDANSRTALHHACACGHAEVVHYLLCERAEAQGQTECALLYRLDKDKKTCLHLACDHEGKAEEEGGEWNAEEEGGEEEDGEGAGADGIGEGAGADGMDNHDVSQKPHEHLARDVRMHLGEHHKHAHEHIVGELCNIGGAKLCNQQDSEGRAALHMCAISGNVILAKKLLATEGGAQQLLLLDKHGQTSLHLAASALSKVTDGPKTADDSMTGIANERRDGLLALIDLFKKYAPPDTDLLQLKDKDGTTAQSILEACGTA